MQPGSFDLIAIPSLTVPPDLDAVEQDDEPYYVSCLNSLNPVQYLIRAKPLRPRGSLHFFPEATLALLDSRPPKFPPGSRAQHPCSIMARDPCLMGLAAKGSQAHSFRHKRRCCTGIPHRRRSAEAESSEQDAKGRGAADLGIQN